MNPEVDRLKQGANSIRFSHLYCLLASIDLTFESIEDYRCTVEEVPKIVDYCRQHDNVVVRVLFSSKPPPPTRPSSKN